MPIPRRLALGLLVPLLLACGQATVPESGVEDRTRGLLSDRHEGVEGVDCPGDLEAEVGVTMECMVTIGGIQRGLTIEVTQVEDDRAQWKVDVEE